MLTLIRHILTNDKLKIFFFSYEFSYGKENISKTN